MTNKCLKKLLLLSAICFLSSGFYYFYTEDFMNIRSEVVENERADAFIPLKTVEGEVVLDHSRIKSTILQQSTDGLNKTGYICIPEIGILLPIFDEAYNPTALKAGANLVRNESDERKIDEMINNEETIVIAAHSYDDGIKAFGPLQQYLNKNEPYLVDGVAGSNTWLNGKTVYVAADEYINVYKIAGQQTYKKNDWSFLDNASDLELNLISCLYPSDTYRIITKCYLIERYSWTEVPEEVLNVFDLDKQMPNLQHNNLSS